MGDPIIFLGSIDLTEELESMSTTHSSQPFHRFLKQINCVFTEANSCPLKHLGLLREVGNIKLGVFGKKFLVIRSDGGVWHLIEESFGFLNISEGFLGRDRDGITFAINN